MKLIGARHEGSFLILTSSLIFYIGMCAPTFCWLRKITMIFSQPDKGVIIQEKEND